MGYQVGASDEDLASVDVPGAHGMVSSMSEQMLERAPSFQSLGISGTLYERTRK